MRSPPSTPKRVILYRWDRQPEEGFVEPSLYLQDERFEWLTPDGRIQVASLEACKALCFVSETARPDLFTDNNLFERRPRTPGLWIRFLFRDGAQLEGVLPHNLLEWPANGYLAIPPQARATRQRVFIPKLSLTKTELRGVVGGTAVTSEKTAQEIAKQGGKQLSIFEL